MHISYIPFLYALRVPSVDPPISRHFRNGDLAGPIRPFLEDPHVGNRWSKRRECLAVRCAWRTDLHRGRILSRPRFRQLDMGAGKRLCAVRAIRPAIAAMVEPGWVSFPPDITSQASTRSKMVWGGDNAPICAMLLSPRLPPRGYAGVEGARAASADCGNCGRMAHPLLPRIQRYRRRRRA